ncbi:protein-S-isoprenylcysteine O-methyltransferase A isoform X2 [Amborella trichopoda]|uniref:protein-S-isoprenylcysteine O-methyltransferase A isoform X2 n=1 Tax=Amborella trichopoda TaxID=13333 RepID=UPI0009BF84FC|nr:protein-S-isoprenylcysteine O-methyltransferase A isoform X2 [Amborella trichopoda]|eukprot:XP_020523614.1 protein-S-isoprenylcysteine O-methyltransferase A isoform X2 [Amborella trichopoda]
MFFLYDLEGVFSANVRENHRISFIAKTGSWVLSIGAMGEFLGYVGTKQLIQMLVAVCFFHSSEFLLAIFIHGFHNVSVSSLLISKQYLIAMACALLEYVVELILVPGLKEQWWISNIGLAMIVVGEIIRKCGILTARQAFTHNIRVYHEDQHELVSHGIYRILRLFHLGHGYADNAMQSHLYGGLYSCYLELLRKANPVSYLSSITI